MFMLQGFILLSFVTLSLCSSSGAPPDACEFLSPGHGFEPQPRESPFTIMVNATSIERGGSVQITVTGSEEFAGFIIQARPDPIIYFVIGKFDIVEEVYGKVVNCSDESDTVTHNSNELKQTVSFLWTAPENFQGTVFFTGTVVKSYTEFWEKIASAAVEVGDPSQSTTTSTVTPPVTTPAPPIDSTFYSGCGKSKSCFGHPPKCVKSKSCNFAMSVVRQNNDNYNFELVSYQADAFYVALALASIDKMSESSVMECVKENNMTNTYTSWMSGRSVSRENIPQNIIRQSNSTVASNYFACVFERDIQTTVNGQAFNLDSTKYYLLLASGSLLRENGIGYHNLGKIASQRESLSVIKIFGEVSQIEYKLHGILMVIAWIGTTSIGVVFARYFKQSFAGQQMCGKDVWFIAHVSCMVATWVLTLVAFALVFIKNQGWSDISNPHPILGVITTVLCFFQPIGAFFRPHPKDSRRIFFNWGHFSAGNLAHLFAILTLFYSVSLAKAELPVSTYWIFASYFAYYLLIHLFLSYLGDVAEPIRLGTLVIHLVAVLAFTITAIVFIYLAPF